MSFAFRNGSCTDDLPPPDCHPVKGCGQRFFSRRIRPAAFEQNRLEPELLSYRAPPELHEPDNFSTFVSSPLDVSALSIKQMYKHALGRFV
jgi:hypothetical protein